MADYTSSATTQDPNQGQILLNIDDSISLDEFLDSGDLLSDPLMWQAFNEIDIETNVLIGNSEHQNSGSQQQQQPQHKEINPSVFSVPRAQQDCSRCQVLRKITHTNGMNVKGLEIHGEIGRIKHAVVGIYDYGSSIRSQDCQMFDLEKESTQTVKKFLVQYYDICRVEGYGPVQDPLSTFYEARSVGSSEPDNANYFLQIRPGTSNLYSFLQDIPETSNANFIQIGQEETTGLTRWPYRKIRKIKGCTGFTEV